MKNEPILNLRGGMDSLSPESDIPNGRVREAVNLVIHDNGSFDRRDGATIKLSITQPHSGSETVIGTLFMAGGTLYRLSGASGALAATSVATGFSGFARYATDPNGVSVWVSAGKLVRVDPDLSVWAAGVASLIGTTPTLTTTAGGLPAGRYGIAFAGVNAIGEESGMSDTAFIELTSSAGIAIALPASAGDAVKYLIYRTTTNGDRLYLADTITAATSATITGGEISRDEGGNWGLDAMPAGTEIAVHGSRLLSAVGSFLCYSPAFKPGLIDARDGAIPFPGNCDRLVLPVDGGVYVGTDDTIYFLQGNGPSEYVFKTVSQNGAFKHSGRIVDASMFDSRTVGGAKKVAVWLSPKGYQIGRPDGSVVSPQDDRILLSGVRRAPSAAFIRDGIHQLISATKVLTVGRGGATDTV